MKPNMKKKPNESVSIPVPVQVSASALAAMRPQCVPAFPTGSRGNDLMVAVPVLLLVPVGKAAGMAETIADAVSIVRSSRVSVERIPVKCVSLSNADEFQAMTQPSVRSRFLSLMMGASSSVSEAMVKEGGHDPREVEQVAREALEVLYLLNASGSLEVSG